MVGHTGAILDLRWSGDGTNLFSASTDKTCGVWDAETVTNPLPPAAPFRLRVASSLYAAVDLGTSPLHSLGVRRCDAMPSSLFLVACTLDMHIHALCARWPSRTTCSTHPHPNRAGGADPAAAWPHRHRQQLQSGTGGRPHAGLSIGRPHGQDLGHPPPPPRSLV